MNGQLQPPVGPDDHAQGPEGAPVTLVEYGDFECPYCGQAYEIVKTIQQRLGGKLRFVFRNFPLKEAHPHAEHAAEAAEAAATRGRFWDMHDLLYENQRRLDDASLAGYAEAIGLDAQRVMQALEDGTYEPQVREDFMSGVRSGVNGTPAFFVNGVRWDGPWNDPAVFLQTLQESAGTRAGR
ncbi:MAG TPA: thioredoxin domain-containing protein [Gemmatimonadales bacterium]